MEMLTAEQLKSMTTKQLYRYFREVRAMCSSILNYEGPRCCEICHEYIGDDWEGEVGVILDPWVDLRELVHAELKSRPYEDLSPRGVRKQRREKIAGLRGNRNRPRNRHHHKPAMSLGGV